MIFGLRPFDINRQYLVYVTFESPLSKIFHVTAFNIFDGKNNYVLMSCSWVQFEQ